MKSKRLVIANDHGGLTLKNEIINFLTQSKIEFTDLGCNSTDSVDYPDFAAKVAQKIQNGEADSGILICGTGVGMAISANKFKGIRAASVFDLYTAKMTREHNDLNVLCLGGRVIGPSVATEIVDIFLKTPFVGGRHQARIQKISDLEK